MLWQFAGYSYLRQTELFRAFDYVALGIACLNLDGQVIYANRALAERLGFPHAQLLAQTWAVFLHSEDHAPFHAHWHQLVNHEVDHFALEVRLRHHSGHWVWALLTGEILPLESGQAPVILMQMQDITERKQQEQKLLIEQVRLREAEAMACLGSWEMELVTGDCWWSDEFYRLCGYAPETAATFEAYMERIHPDDYPRMAEAVRLTILKGQPFAQEIRLCLPNGQEKWVIVRGAVDIVDELPSRLRGYLLDISEFKLQADQAQQHAQVLATFYKSAPFMMGLVALLEDEDILHLSDNLQAAQFWGASPDFLAGKKASELQTPPEIRARWWQLYRLAGESGQALTMEYLHVQPDREVWLRVVVAPIDIADQLYCYIAEDITAQKQKSALLKATESRFESIFNTMFTFMGLLSPDGELLEVNPVALELLQIDLAAVRGQLLWNTPWFDDLPQEQKRLEQAVQRARTGEFVRYESEIRGLHGELAIDVSLRPGRNEAGQVAYLIAEGRDISELKRQQEALQHSNRELQEFAYVVSHDLQEPVRKILAFGQFLQEKMPQLDLDSKDYLNRSLQAANRMQELIRALLSYSRLTETPPVHRPIDLSQVLDEVLETLELRIQEQQAQVYREPLPTVRGDHIQLRQLFQNLLANSLKFTHPDRLPMIRLSIHALRPLEVVLLLEDNGIGFAPEDGERIFQIFQRLEAHRHYPGTGIGLATCRKIIEQHHGSISAEGMPGQGARFLISLPLAAVVGAPLPDEIVQERSSAPHAWPERILLVDDDEEEYLLLQVMLARQSPHSVLVWEAQLAGGLRRLLTESWDLALIDYYLGAEDGLQLIREARAQGVITPLFLRSGREDSELALRAHQEGANGVIPKSTLLMGRFEPIHF
jgi:PAS domain S-box-containing protein